MRINKITGSLLDYLRGNFRVCEFALTNVCVSKCSFCSIWKQKKKIIVDREKALKTIDILSELGVRFITFTGGEPLTHPNIIEFVEKCTKYGIITAVLDADPRLITDAKIAGLKKAGLDYMCISIDHYTDKIEYQSRKISNLLNHIKYAVNRIKKAKIKTIASILISNFNWNDLEKLFDKCNEIGFDYIAINYPEHSLSPVYELGGEMVKLTPKQTIFALKKVIKLKKKGYKIMNSVLSMENIIKYLKKEKVKYYCLGGNKVLFVDWFFNVYPCMHLSKHMGSIFEFTKEKLLKTLCNKCNMSWYRDFSVYFQGWKSVKPLINFLRN